MVRLENVQCNLVNMHTISVCRVSVSYNHTRLDRYTVVTREHFAQFHTTRTLNSKHLALSISQSEGENSPSCGILQ